MTLTEEDAFSLLFGLSLGLIGQCWLSSSNGLVKVLGLYFAGDFEPEV